MCEELRELMKEDLDAALEKGKQIGEERGREVFIMNVLKTKRSAEEVAELLGVSLEEVKAVEKKL